MFTGPFRSENMLRGFRDHEKRRNGGKVYYFLVSLKLSRRIEPGIFFCRANMSTKLLHEVLEAV